MKLGFLERARVLAPLKHAPVVDVGMWLQLFSHALAKRGEVLGPRRKPDLLPNLRRSASSERAQTHARTPACMHTCTPRTRAHAHSHTRIRTRAHTRARACTHARASTHPAIERGAIGHAASGGAAGGGCGGAARGMSTGRGGHLSATTAASAVGNRRLRWCRQRALHTDGPRAWLRASAVVCVCLCHPYPHTRAQRRARRALPPVAPRGAQHPRSLTVSLRPSSPSMP